MGKARARAQYKGLGEYSAEEGSSAGDGVLCFQVHGDAAFAAQVDTHGCISCISIIHV